MYINLYGISNLWYLHLTYNNNNNNNANPCPSKYASKK